MTSTQQNEGTDVELVLSAAVAERFHEMASMIPDAASGGMENIIAAIFEAETANDLEAPWTGGARKLPLGVPIKIMGISKTASDYKASLGFYLVLDCVVLHNGEVVEYVTGSISIVAQLVKAHSLNLFPLVCQAVEAAKPSKNGTMPQHLEIIDNGGQPAKKSRRG